MTSFDDQVEAHTSCGSQINKVSVYTATVCVQKDLFSVSRVYVRYLTDKRSGWLIYLFFYEKLKCCD